MTNQPQHTETENAPRWLKKLAQNSWEAELLISGGAIFSLLHASDNWVELFHTFKNLYRIPGQGPLFIFGMLAINALTIGFMVHLLCRAYWVALFCLQLAFPEGVTNDTSLKKPFKNTPKGANIQKQVEFVNKLSGVIFYLSLFITIGMIGLIVALGVFIFVIIKLDGSNSLSYYLEMIFMFAFFAYLADLALFGLFRKIPYLSYVFYPIARFFDFISLRFVYARSIQILLSNVAKWKIAISMLFFLSATVLYSYPYMYKPMRWPNILSSMEYRNYLARDDEEYYKLYYEINYNDDTQIRTNVTLNDEIIDDYLKCNIVYGPITEEFMQERINLINDTALTNTYFEDLFDIYIDDSLCTNLDWMENAKISDKQFGLTTIMDVNHLKRGKHLFSFKPKMEYFPKDDRELDSLRFYVDIPFWKK
jgi:hypothetical protein